MKRRMDPGLTLRPSDPHAALTVTQPANRSERRAAAKAVRRSRIIPGGTK